MLAAAFLLGLTGSLHCAGMCGVLAYQAGRSVNTAAMYHAGRLATYMLMGLLAGWLSQFMTFTGWLGWFSVILGLFVVLMLVFRSAAKWLTARFNRGLFVVQKNIGLLLKRKNIYASLGVGALNGLLPCGLVYSAVVIALVQPGIGQSMAVMLLFGLGTVPALLMVNWFAGNIMKSLPVSVQQLQNAMLAVTGFLLIWRGASMINLFSIHDSVLCYPLP